MHNKRFLSPLIYLYCLEGTVGFAGLKPTTIPGRGAGVGLGRDGGSLFGGGGLDATGGATLGLVVSLLGFVGGAWGRGGGGGFLALLGGLDGAVVSAWSISTTTDTAGAFLLTCCLLGALFVTDVL